MNFASLIDPADLFMGEGAKKAAKHAERAQKAEARRIAKARKDAMERQVFSTKEGGGIMHEANISLGFDDTEEDELDEQFSTGLII